MQLLSYFQFYEYMQKTRNYLHSKKKKKTAIYKKCKMKIHKLASLFENMVH